MVCGPIWLLGGDFNVIHWPSRAFAQNLAKYIMKKFNNFITKFDLLDPPLTNGAYTWSNFRTRPVLSRLDHFLYTTH